jgi:hypothetical protein
MARNRLSSSRVAAISRALPELAPAEIFSGCRGFIGPVPPPLWMSARERLWLFNCCSEFYYKTPYLQGLNVNSKCVIIFSEKEFKT